MFLRPLFHLTSHYYLLLQLSEENYEAAVAELSQVIQMSESSSVDQNPTVLNTTADYITGLAVFLTTANVTITENVSFSEQMHT